MYKSIFNYIYIVSLNSTANQTQHTNTPTTLSLQAFTGLFTNFSWAIAQGKGLVPRSLAKMMMAFIGFWCMKTWHETFILGPEDSIDFQAVTLDFSFLVQFLKHLQTHIRLGPFVVSDFRRRLHDVAVSFDAHLHLAPLHLACATRRQRRGAKDLGRCGPIAISYKLWLGFEFYDPGHGNNKASFIVMSRPKKKNEP